MATVKFYGGVAHGQVRTIRDNERRVEVCSYGHHSRDDFRYALHAPPDMNIRNRIDRDSYEIHRYYEECGNCRRYLDIAQLEGTKLLDREKYELDRDMDQVPWQPITIPSFLYEFERWYNVKMYQITGRREFITGELYLPPSRRSLVDEYGRLREYAA